jgi:phosphopantothenoylcysteine decarboxylase/phosphopantothenate--cysteine ligase
MMRVVVGVCGGIAAYKTADLVRRFRERGDEVSVILTAAGRQFVTPLTLSVLTGGPVHESLFDPPFDGRVVHVELAHRTDLFVVAPATADMLSRLASGSADDFLTTFALSYPGRILIAPAMETQMWEHPAVAENVRLLQSRGARFVGPASGFLASGRTGIGRMAEPDEILEAAVVWVDGKNDLAGRRVLVTAGPTREAIDPIRFISNRSSGKMGIAMAKTARERGAEVTLLAGPGDFPLPAGVRVVRFESASELAALLAAEFSTHDVLAMAAAVADFIPEKFDRRIHRSEGPRSLSLRPGEDLLATVAAGKGKRVIVAFAAESGAAEEAAREKMRAKSADWIAINDVSKAGIGFDEDDNEMILLSADGRRLAISRRPKIEVARAIWDAVVPGLA